MDWIVRAIGLFYVVSGVFLVRAMALDAMAHTLEGIVYGPKAGVRVRHYWLRIGAALTVASGLALVLLSPLTIALMLANCVVQGGWLLYARTHFPPEDEDEALGRRRTTNAFVVFAIVTAVVSALFLTGVIAYNGGPVTSKWVPVGYFLPLIGGVGVFLAMLVG